MSGDCPGIFPISPFPPSRPIRLLSSTYEEQSRKGPRHNPDLSRPKWETPWFGFSQSLCNSPEKWPLSLCRVGKIACRRGWKIGTHDRACLQLALRVSGAKSPVFNRESCDSESCNLNRMIPRLRLNIDRLRFGLAILNRFFRYSA